jgi:hypothetical protein
MDFQDVGRRYFEEFQRHTKAVGTEGDANHLERVTMEVGYAMADYRMSEMLIDVCALDSKPVAQARHLYAYQQEQIIINAPYDHESHSPYTMKPLTGDEHPTANRCYASSMSSNMALIDQWCNELQKEAVGYGVFVRGPELKPWLQGKIELCHHSFDPELYRVIWSVYAEGSFFWSYGNIINALDFYEKSDHPQKKITYEVVSIEYKCRDESPLYVVQ